jgi:hypothetical protein
MPSAIAADSTRGCGDAPNAPICARGSPWYELGGAEIRARLGGAEQQFTLKMMSANDLRVHYRIAERGVVNEGEVLLIGGYALALKGGHVEPGYEGDYLDGPVLAMEAVVTLLDVAIPAGPKAVKDRHQIMVSEPRRQISTATPSASAQYGAPWSVKGQVRRVSEETLAYDLAFTFVPLDPFGLRRIGQPAQTFTFKGTLDYPPERTALSDDFDLTDWNVLGPGSAEPKPRTVGDVRAKIKRETNPGPPGPTK